MLRVVEKQFRQPKGIIGKFISRLMRKENSIVYDRLIDILDIKDQENIFEIGYGHGLGIEKILARNDCNISGIDFSELMKDEASKRNKYNIEKGKVKLFYGDFLTYDIKPNLYDKVICLNVIYFWNNLEAPFTKIRYALKEHGEFCLYMDHPDDLTKQGFRQKDIFNKYEIDQVIEKLKLSGFNKIDYQNIGGYYIKSKL